MNILPAKKHLISRIAVAASVLLGLSSSIANASEVVFSHTFDSVDNEVGPALQIFDNGAGETVTDSVTGELSGVDPAAPGFNAVSGIDLSEYSKFTIEFVVENNYSGVSATGRNGSFFGITNSTTSNATDGSALYNNAGNATGTSIGLQVGTARGDGGADFVLDEASIAFTPISAPNDDTTDGYVISITYAEDADSGNTNVTIFSTGLDADLDFSVLAETNYATLASLVTPNASTQGGALDFSSIIITAETSSTEVDTDGDGTPDATDTDDDDDGVLDDDDAFPLDDSESVDTDGDGMGNNADTDDDGDGVLDTEDAFPLDSTKSVDDTNTPEVVFSHTFDSVDNEIGPALQIFDNAAGETITDILTGELSGVDPAAPGFNTVSGIDLSGYTEFTVEFVVENNYSGVSATGRNGSFFGIVNSTTSNATDGSALYNNAGNATGTSIGLQVGTARGGGGADFVLDEANIVFTPISAPNDDVTDGYVLSITYAMADDGDTEVSVVSSGLDVDLDFTTVAATNFNTLASLVTPNTSTQGGALDFSSITITASSSNLVFDTDEDGITNDIDTDDDNDGVLDGDDAFPLDDSESADTDSDGTGNNADSDDDNDNVLDFDDAFPLDATESVDTDGDGIGNNTDTDDDNDGVEDGQDAFPFDATESLDSDGDGVGDNFDTDDDNDGVLDIDETSAEFINISTRSYVLDGDKVMIAGFVIEGTEPISVLVQGVGSELDEDPYFVQDSMLDTVIGIYDQSGALILQNDDWDTDSDEANANLAANDSVGAFTLVEGSKSSAIFTTLDPGVYTAILSGKNEIGGVALLEVYNVSSIED